MKKLLLVLMLLSCPAWAAISLDTINHSTVNTASFTWTHTVNAGSNSALIVSVGCRNGNLVICRGATVTYNAVAMTLVGSQEESGDGNIAYLFQLVSPSSGANTVSVTLGGTVVSASGGSVSLFGVNQSTPVDVSGGASFLNATATVTLVTTVNNDWIIDSYSGTGTWSSWGVGQTDIFHSATNGTQGASYKGPVSTGSNTNTANFTGTSQEAYFAASIVPAAGAAAPTGFNKKQKLEKVDPS